MRRAVLLLGSMALAVLLSSNMRLESNPIQAQQSPKKPNVILLLTDDMRTSDLAHMPNVEKHLVQRGTTFSNHFTTLPTCCPSRVTFMRGQYAHNHKIGFSKKIAPTGWDEFRERGYHRSTVATWLQGGGYRTGLVGKYLNGFRAKRYVPPGWNRFYAAANRDVWATVYNSNGRPSTYDQGHQDVHLGSIGRRFVENAAGGQKPFFLFQNFYSPHRDYSKPPPALEHDLSGMRAYGLKTPAFNERDISDKPSWIRSQQLLTDEQIDEMRIEQRHRLASLQTVDRAVAKLVAALAKSGELDNTYIFMTSDNGWHMGEHRMTGGKMTSYINDVRVPLIVRGPGVAKGVTRQKIVDNVDFAPTAAELAGVQVPRFVDGRSMVPLLEGKTGESVGWRDETLIEGRGPERGLTGAPKFFGLVTAEGEHYVEYHNGERELYNLRNDPYQLKNLLAGASGDPRVEALSERLAELKSCTGEECRQ